MMPHVNFLREFVSEQRAVTSWNCKLILGLPTLCVLRMPRGSSATSVVLIATAHTSSSLQACTEDRATL